jgi:murein tripeptide amidase MpaA
MDFNRYFNNEELEKILRGWAEEYPQIVALSQLGESFEKRPLWLLTITNRETGDDTTKPALWIDGNIHATEIAGTTTCLYIIHHLLTNYIKDESIKTLIDRSTFYIGPRVNPDGAALAMASNPQYLRSGVRAYPYEEKDEGLHEEDIDGDGRILQIRIPDPGGDWKVSSLDPRLMEKCRPDETEGKFYRLLMEGIINEWDGYIIKEARPFQGLDFNRNFPFEWKPEGEQQGSGPYPASEPEINAVVDFISRHPNISIAITYHTFSRVILRPYSTKPDDDMETEDLWVFQKMGEIGANETGYRCVSTFHDFKYHPKKVTVGAFDDWIYDQLGIYSFTIELWDLPTAAGIENRKFIEWFREHPHEDDLKILQWVEENVGEGYYHKWRPFDHPQLGKVEIGGWDHMYSWRNPPASFMEAEAARNLPFVLSLGNMLPRLSLHTLETTPLGDSSFRINLVINNNGFLPTFTSLQGKKRGAIRPVRAEIDAPEGVKLKAGKRRVELGHLEGRSNKLSVTSTFSMDPTDNRGRAEWVVSGDPGSVIKIKIHGERAGTLTQEVTLLGEGENR